MFPKIFDSYIHYGFHFILITTEGSQVPSLQTVTSKQLIEYEEDKYFTIVKRIKKFEDIDQEYYTDFIVNLRGDLNEAF